MQIYFKNFNFIERYSRILISIICIIGMSYGIYPDDKSDETLLPSPFIEKGKTSEAEIFSDKDTQPKSVSLKLTEAEEMFTKNNLVLLASKFQIDAKKASIMQAKLWANPSLYLENNIYNYQTQRWFDQSPMGNQIVQIQQLFLLGGKIDKRVRVAEINAKISEQMFFDLLRVLKLQLRQSYFRLYYFRQALDFYNKSIASLEKTVEFAEKAYEKRALLLAEVIRLKALIFFLKNERTDAIVQMKQNEAALKVLVNNPEYLEKEMIPEVEKTSLDDVTVKGFKLTEVLEEAYINRPDLKIAIQNVKYEEANLELQKAMAIPDLGFGPNFNRNGSANPNYFGLTAQVNIPIWDRNQGNITAAEKSILTKRSELQNQKLLIENEIAIRLNKAQEKDKLYKTYKNKISEDYAKLADVMIGNYKKRYLTIIEFADFFETYRTTTMQMIKLQSDRIDAIEELNYAVGRSLIHLQKTTPLPDIPQNNQRKE